MQFWNPACRFFPSSFMACGFMSCPTPFFRCSFTLTNGEKRALIGGGCRQQSKGPSGLLYFLPGLSDSVTSERPQARSGFSSWRAGSHVLPSLSLAFSDSLCRIHTVSTDTSFSCLLPTVGGLHWEPRGVCFFQLF